MRSEVPQDAGPDPGSRLARRVLDASTDDERNQALNALEPLIRHCARQISRGDYSQETRDLLDEAPSVIWEKIASYRAEKGRFETWCRVVLHRWQIDRIRRRGANLTASADRLDLDQLLDSSDADRARRACEAALDRGIPLSRNDLDRIAGWRVETRVLLMCLSGLWFRIPSDVWNDWLADCEVEPPFPPDDFLDLERTGERYATLAPALGVSVSTLTKRVERTKHLLLELDALDHDRGT